MTFAEEIRLAITTIKVVTLTPPAVDPEFPPINIKIIVSNFPELVSSFKLTELKPAVLGLIDKNNELKILSARENSWKLPFCPTPVNSKTKNKIAGKIISKELNTNTIFV